LAKGKKKAGDSSEDRVPAEQKMTRKKFEKELYTLQVELTRLQAWAVAKRARVIVVFEGRDTAGKGGVISRITQRCSPRVFKHVALPAPSDRDRSQLYIQRYIAQFPAAGEMIRQAESSRPTCVSWRPSRRRRTGWAYGQAWPLHLDATDPHHGSPG
jgi:polyphosphate kinase 2 (PPK2 family)